MTHIATRTLACGMPLIVESNPGVRSAALTWLTPAGSARDPEHLQGLSALWSELIFRGCGELDSKAHADAMDRFGLSRSTDVGTHYVRFSTTMIGSVLSQALPLIVETVRAPRFDESSIEPARELGLQGLDALKDDPQERASIAARRRHFPVPINRSGLGTVEGLTAITRDDIVRGWDARARPIGSILSVAGDLSSLGSTPEAATDRLAGMLDGLLTGWAGAAPSFTLGPTPPRGYEHETDNSNQVHIILMHPAPAEPEPTSLLEKTAISVLSGGMSCRLFSEVREKRGLCYSVSAGYTGDREYGACVAYVGTTPERAQQSLDVLTAELLRINSPDGPVTQSEFARAVTGMKSKLIFQGESTAARAAALAYDQHRLGRPRSLSELAADIDRLTLARVNDYLRTRTLGRATIQTIGPAALTPPAL